MNLILRLSDGDFRHLRYAAQLHLVSHTRLAGLAVGDDSITSPRLDVVALFVDPECGKRAMDAVASSLATGARLCDLRPYTRLCDGTEPEARADLTALRHFVRRAAHQRVSDDMALILSPQGDEEGSPNEEGGPEDEDEDIFAEANPGPD